MASRTREIVAAAARVFAEKGYHAATVQDVANAAGILKGSLYHHVSSKEELLYLVIKEPIARLYRVIRRIAASRLPPAEKLRRAAEAHLQALHDHHPHLFVYLRETEDVQRWFRGTPQLSPKVYERLFQQILREGVRTGVFRRDIDLKVTSYGLLGMLNWLYKWYQPDGRLGPREISNQFVSLALVGLTGGVTGGGPQSGRRSPPGRRRAGRAAAAPRGRK